MRHRKLVLAVWIVLCVLGGAGAANVSKLRSNQVSVPGSDSQRGLNLLRSHFHERGDGAITLVAQPTGGLLSPARAHQANLLDPTDQIVQIRAAGFSDSGTTAASDLVHRIRER